MTYDITKKTLEAQPVLYRSNQCEQAAIAKAMGESLPAVAHYATEKGFTMVGPPFSRYTSFSPELVSFDAGIPVAPGASGDAEKNITAGELCAGDVARTIHKGPYDGLREAYAALEKWIAAEGLEMAGAPWEVYLTDPGELPNPEEWLTEILWPVK